MTFHPYGPTRGVGAVGSSANDDTITFSWGAAPTNGNPITGYRLTGDVNTTVGPGTRSHTFSGLGYSTTRGITVTPIADRSGAGPSSSKSDTTNAKPPPPPPQVISFGHGSRCNNDCLVVTPSRSYQCGGSCYHLGYTLQGFEGAISCTFDGTDTNGQSWGADNGRNGTVTPRNGSNNSHKFYGLPSGWVSIHCTGSNGTATATANPWG